MISYRDEGVLPLALFNFLAQLGAYLGEEPYLTMDQILNRFDLGSLKKAASVFDRDRLAFVNYKLILDTPASVLRGLLVPFLRVQLEGKEAAEPSEAAIDIMKSRSKNLKDLAMMLIPFVTEDYPISPEGIQQYTRDLTALTAMESLLAPLENLAESEWTPACLEEVLRAQAQVSGLKAGALIHLCRLFLTGTTASPGIFEVLAAMGKAGTLRRLRRGLREARRQAGLP